MQGPLILDRYRPIEVKGEGGSGRVEICWDTRIQRRVAIKRMPISNAQANGVVTGLSEARTGAMLSRPSIVSVYDFDRVDDEAFLIMEAIDGPSLAQIIHDTPAGSFDLDIAAAIILAVGDAVEFAHENQVLHLDIKPDNILVNRNGACKVSDFGVSELADAQGFRKASGGTIGYMPPEQMNGHMLDERTDEFALAAVVYEILTGKRPFAANSLDASAKLIQKFDVTPPSSVRLDLDPGIDSVLFTALSPDPEDRYDSIADFLTALMPYLGNAAQGSRRLREIVQVDDEVVEEQSYAPKKRGILDRVSPNLSVILGRVIAAALCWWISTSAFFNITMIDTNIAMLIALLPAVAAAVKPPFGALLAMLINGVSLFLCPVPMPVLGVVAIAAAIAWVVLFGREGVADTNCALIISPLGLVGFAPLAPMIAGYCLPPRRALGAAIIQVVLMLTVGKNTGPELLFGSITSIPTWIMICGWIIATVLMSVLCVRETRILSILGAICAALILLIAQGIGLTILTGFPTGPSGTWAITTVLACVAMCVVGVLGSSVRHKGE